jgi:hypothetical protein
MKLKKVAVLWRYVVVKMKKLKTLLSFSLIFMVIF